MIKFTKMLMEEFLEQDLFSLFIQPVVDFRNDRVFNGEVLSRLNHPEYGMIFPDQFLPAIDALDLHLKFDRYIFQKACIWLHHALSQGYQIGCVSCNFSRKRTKITDCQHLVTASFQFFYSS